MSKMLLPEVLGLQIPLCHPVLAAVPVDIPLNSYG